MKMDRRARLALAALALFPAAACMFGDDEEIELLEDPEGLARDQVHANVAPSEVGAGWEPIPPAPSGELRAAPFPSAPGARLVIFGASWCPGCVASVLEDASLARRYRGRVEVGIAIRDEDDATFLAADSSRWLAGTTVWTSESTRAVGDRCGVRFLPFACFVDGDRVLWTGGSSDAPAILDAHLAGDRETAVARADAAEQELARVLAGGDASRVLTPLRGFANRENSLSWGLVGERDDLSPSELNVAIALAEDATNATGAMNSAILDTYAVALWKANRRADAARVAARVIAVCDALETACSEERPRAQEYMRAGG